MMGSTPRARDQQRPKSPGPLKNWNMNIALTIEEIELLEEGLAALLLSTAVYRGIDPAPVSALKLRLGRLASTIISDQLGSKRYDKKK